MTLATKKKASRKSIIRRITPRKSRIDAIHFKQIYCHFLGTDTFHRENKCDCCDNPWISMDRDLSIVENLNEAIKDVPGEYNYRFVWDYNMGKPDKAIDSPCAILYHEDLGKMPICRGTMFEDVVRIDQLRNTLDWSPKDAVLGIFDTDTNNLVPVQEIMFVSIDADTRSVVLLAT